MKLSVLLSLQFQQLNNLCYIKWLNLNVSLFKNMKVGMPVYLYNMKIIGIFVHLNTEFNVVYFYLPFLDSSYSFW